MHDNQNNFHVCFILNANKTVISIQSDYTNSDAVSDLVHDQVHC